VTRWCGCSAGVILRPKRVWLGEWRILDLKILATLFEHGLTLDQIVWCPFSANYSIELLRRARAFKFAHKKDATQGQGNSGREQAMHKTGLPPEVCTVSNREYCNLNTLGTSPQVLTQHSARHLSAGAEMCFGTLCLDSQCHRMCDQRPLSTLPHHSHRRPSDLLFCERLERRMCLALFIVVFHIVERRESRVCEDIVSLCARVIHWAVGID
jgi:hypothetical protein